MTPRLPKLSLTASTRTAGPLARSGSRTWAVIAALVVFHEFSCPEGELLSEAVDRALDKHPVLVRGLVLITAVHLINWLPPQIDPYHGLFHISRKVIHGRSIR